MSYRNVRGQRPYYTVVKGPSFKDLEELKPDESSEKALEFVYVDRSGEKREVYLKPTCVKRGADVLTLQAWVLGDLWELNYAPETMFGDLTVVEALEF